MDGSLLNSCKVKLVSLVLLRPVSAWGHIEDLETIKIKL